MEAAVGNSRSNTRNYIGIERKNRVAQHGDCNDSEGPTQTSHLLMDKNKILQLL